MSLFLAQHGDAVAKSVNAERPLSESGRADVQRVADYLKMNSMTVSRVLHSGKTRARQSAELLAATLGCGEVVQAVDNLNPNDPVEPWVEAAGHWAEDVLLVGHLPFMAKLATRLACAAASHPVLAFQPGTVVALERSSEGDWQIEWMIRPDLLRR